MRNTLVNPNCFSLVNAAVVCAILESILGLEPSSAITEPRYLKLVTALETVTSRQSQSPLPSKKIIESTLLVQIITV